MKTLNTFKCASVSALGALSLMSCAEKNQISDNSRPNIIFILADDMGYGDVSALNPESKFKTPVLDNIAQKGVLFTNAHSNASVSTPSRYGIVTGRYTWRSSLKKGVLQGYSPSILENDRPTVASMLKAQGYNTACVGKWHIGMNGWQSTDGEKVLRNGDNVDFEASRLEGPTAHGFDYFYGISASLDMPPYLMIENDRVIEQPDVFYGPEENNPYGRPGHAIKGRTPDYFLGNLIEKAVSKIGEFSKEADPFFLYLPIPSPHTPVAPAKEFVGKSGVSDYCDYMMEVDYRIGQIYAALEANGIDKNTLVVISSDNGPERIAYERFLECNHSSAGELRGVKRDLWEGGHRVPMMVTWGDKIQGGRKIDETVCLLDFYATVAEVTNHQLVAGEAPDSYSYLPLLNGDKDCTPRKYTIHHASNGTFAVRSGDWVLIEKGTGDSNGPKSSPEYYQARGYKIEKNDGALYNLNKDLQERSNLYDQHPEIVEELTGYLNECRNAEGSVLK